MAENPLLPNDQLRALLALTRQCARLDNAAARTAVARSEKKPRKGKVNVPLSREALIGGTVLHLQPGDVLLAAPSDVVTRGLAPVSAAGKGVAGMLPGSLSKSLGGKTPRLLLGAAMAAALRAAETDRFVMVHLDPSSSEPNWSAALRWAQEELLPVIVVCADARGGKAFQPSASNGEDIPSWGAVQRAAARLQMPVLSLDGEDAVAVYRATQESVLRARSGAGPAVLWAMLPSTRDLASGDRKSNAAPVARLQRYLRVRRISPLAP